MNDINVMPLLQCLHLGTPVFAAHDISERHLGLNRFEPPMTALVTDTFLFTQVLPQDLFNEMIHYGFYLINRLDIPGEGQVITACSLLNNTLHFLIELPKGTPELYAGSYFVVNPRTWEIQVYQSMRSFCRSWIAQ